MGYRVSNQRLSSEIGFTVNLQNEALSSGKAMLSAQE